MSGEVPQCVCVCALQCYEVLSDHEEDLVEHLRGAVETELETIQHKLCNEVSGNSYSCFENMS